MERLQFYVDSHARPISMIIEYPVPPDVTEPQILFLS